MGNEPGVLHAIAIDLAGGAAQLVRAGRRGGVSVDSKSTATDLVTQVDRASESWLSERLAVLRPGDALLGEEGASRPGTTGVRWIVDPIDGTVNFVLGLPQYAVSVAAELDGAVVAGAVANPATGQLFHAVRGGGAWLQDADGTRRLPGPRAVPLERAVVGTGFAYDRRVRRAQAAVAAEVLGEVADLRRLGAAALDLCFVAAGWLDAHFEAGLNPWDHAAGGLIAREAGALVTGLRDRPAGTEFALTAGADLHGPLTDLLERLDADAVLAAGSAGGR